MDFDMKDPSMYCEDNVAMILSRTIKMFENDIAPNEMPILIKSMQIIRNSICFDKFPKNGFNDLLCTVIKCLTNPPNNNDTIKLISTQIIHNFLSSTNEFSNYDNSLHQIMTIIIELSSDEMSSLNLKSTIWLLLFCFSSPTVFSADYVSKHLDKSCLLSLLEDHNDEDYTENRDILLEELIDKSTNFVSNCLANLDSDRLATLFESLDTPDRNISIGNLNSLIDFVISAIDSDNDLFQSQSAPHIDVVRRILWILSTLCDGDTIRRASLERQLALSSSIVALLQKLRLYDDDASVDVSLKSDYRSKPSEAFAARPIYNVKKSIVMLLGNMSHENEPLQNAIVAQGGLEAVMECTRIDSCNLYVQQHAIFAVRNICTGNDVACARVHALTRQDGGEMLKLLNYDKVDRDGVEMFLPKK